MQFLPTPIPGLFSIDLDPNIDARGSFTRLFDAQTFTQHSIPLSICQVSRSRTTSKGTLRGLHLQLPPAAEYKLIWCVRGAIHDVVLDLRPASPTMLQHVANHLSGPNSKLLLVPPGCAHGFQALSDDAELVYFMSSDYTPSLARTVRWNDPAFSINWPLPVSLISDADAAAPDYDPLRPIWPVEPVGRST